MEMTRCMLHEKDLPKRFWGKAANTIMCLQNRISTKDVKDLKPFEVWYGYKPSLKFLRIFWCLCFTYIPQVMCNKLDKKAEAGIFVGYSISCVIVSRHVHFARNEQWNWEELTKVNQISNAPNNLIFSNMLENSEDERQDALVDDAPVRGGAFSDQEKQNLGVG